MNPPFNIITFFDKTADQAMRFWALDADRMVPWLERSARQSLDNQWAWLAVVAVGVVGFFLNPLLAVVAVVVLATVIGAFPAVSPILAVFVLFWMTNTRGWFGRLAVFVAAIMTMTYFVGVAMISLAPFFLLAPLLLWLRPSKVMMVVIAVLAAWGIIDWSATWRLSLVLILIWAATASKYK